jgi:hypothetical protein
MSEDDFFASPPAVEEGDTPIVLGPPSDDPFSAPSGDAFAAPPNDDPFAAPAPVEGGEPTYLGEVNEAPASSYDEAPPPAEEPVAPAEPGPMAKWNAEWQETLIVRKEEENARKAELLEKAKNDLEAFALEREQKREAAMAKNRQDEQEKLEAIEADLENDNSWQRVCKLVELQHDSAAEAADLKRMRDVLIHLKNDPAKAQELSA